MVMTPGTYLAKRRTAADYEIRDLAIALAEDGAHVDRLCAQLVRLEADQEHATPAVISAIQGFVPLDVTVYVELLDLHLCGPGLPEPQLCRVCACSWHQPCETDAGPCAWATPDLCTACEPEDPGGGEPMPVDDDPSIPDTPHPANDPELGIAA